MRFLSGCKLHSQYRPIEFLVAGRQAGRTVEEVPHLHDLAYRDQTEWIPAGPEKRDA